MDSATILFIVRISLYLILLILFAAQKSCIKDLENINDELIVYNTKLMNEIVKLMKENKDNEIN